MEKIMARIDNHQSHIEIKRPNIIERQDYKPAWPQEEFMVTLLRRYIEEILFTYCQPVTSNSRVLDVGCGRQPFRINLEKLGYIYSSLDAQQNPESSVNIVCQIDKILPPQMIDLGCFDFIFCTEVLEHVADWDMAFSNFTKLLASGGKLLITCPHFYQLHEEPYDFWRPTPYALKYFGNRFRLKILHQVQAGDAWDVLGTLIANCHPTPLSKSFSNCFLNIIVLMFGHILFKIIASRRLQANVKLNSPLYMSNIILFEKQ